MARPGYLGGAGAVQPHPACGSPPGPAVPAALLLAASPHCLAGVQTFRELGFFTPVPKDLSNSPFTQHLGEKGVSEEDIVLSATSQGLE